MTAFGNLGAATGFPLTCGGGTTFSLTLEALGRAEVAKIQVVGKRPAFKSEVFCEDSSDWGANSDHTTVSRPPKFQQHLAASRQSDPEVYRAS